MVFVCFGKNYRKIDEGVRHQVSNPWCHECSWDYVSLVLIASLANNLEVFKTTFYCGKILCKVDEQEV
jgi:hypothetical protein